jgi:hypothetical protein
MTIPVTTAPYLAATLLLGAAGVAKMARPSSTANALRAAGLPASLFLVRLLASAEIAVAILALAAPGRLTGALVAAVYVAFALFIVVALHRRWVLLSCGCFGRPDTPPTVAHAVLNAGAAVSAGWWAATWHGSSDGDRLRRIFVVQPWHGAPLMLVTLVLSGLAYLVWTDPLPGARQ